MSKNPFVFLGSLLAALSVALGAVGGIAFIAGWGLAALGAFGSWGKK